MEAIHATVHVLPGDPWINIQVTCEVPKMLFGGSDLVIAVWTKIKPDDAESCLEALADACRDGAKRIKEHRGWQEEQLEIR